jgi:hypothetical protein
MIAYSILHLPFNVLMSLVAFLPFEPGTNKTIDCGQIEQFSIIHTLKCPMPMLLTKDYRRVHESIDIIGQKTISNKAGIQIAMIHRIDII